MAENTQYGYGGGSSFAVLFLIILLLFAFPIMFRGGFGGY